MMQASYLKFRTDNVEQELERAPATSFYSLHIASTFHLQQHHDVYAKMIQEARQYIHSNFCQKISVEQIARKVFVSQYHFSRLFKKYTRYSPYQYLLNVRLEHARKLVCQRELSIKEITFKSGFSSIDHFSAAFNKRYGRCPSAYKKEITSKTAV